MPEIRDLPRVFKQTVLRAQVHNCNNFGCAGKLGHHTVMHVELNWAPIILSCHTTRIDVELNSIFPKYHENCNNLDLKSH